MAFTRALFAFLALPGVAAGVVPMLILGGRFHLGPAAVAGGAMMVAGGFLLLWCVRDFFVCGRGTIAPWDPPKRLVVGGPYRLVRNPMYIAVLALVGGWALAFASLALTAYLAVLGAGFHGRVVLGEELWLRRRFGPEWDVYCRQVPRWLPRLALLRAGPGR
jgi:protein-S-isoprenylcysteine O-methyltransferase Ste14